MAKSAKKKRSSPTSQMMLGFKGKHSSRGSKSAPRRARSPSLTKPKSRRRGATAAEMAARQREISVSEFFAKNRHLLGFDNPRKALLTTVKEAVDNALDACEEAHILPELEVRIVELAEDRYRLSVTDNGPGIIKAQIPNIFGKLLYGSKFHRLKMSRGQQGIGISAAGMYGMLTTGKGIVITSRVGKGKPAHHYVIQINTKKNVPEVIKDEVVEFDLDHGTRVEIELEARYQKGRQSVDEYLEQAAIANSHAQIVYHVPTKETRTFPRASDQLPEEPREIKPHPYGIELGVLIKMLKDSKHRTLAAFLCNDFSRVSARVAQEICKKAKLSARASATRIAHKEAENLYRAINQTRIMAPPTNCLAPIGPKAILSGLLKEIRAEFYTASTRPPAVYRGNPFQVEVGLAFGGNLVADQNARVIRYANRVPLLYQQSACCSYKAVVDTNWRQYGMSQSRDAIPQGPLVIMVHMASVWVPFTSESKEAIADYDEIRKELRLGLQECGRKLNTFVRRRQRAAREGQRRGIFERYIGEVVQAVDKITRVNKEKLYNNLMAVAKKKTEQADVELDEEGRPIKGKRKPSAAEKQDENTVIVDRPEPAAVPGELFDESPAPKKGTAKKSRRMKRAS